MRARFFGLILFAAVAAAGKPGGGGGPPPDPAILYNASGNLMVMNEDGSNQTLLLGGAGSSILLSPSWSPDGTKAVFNGTIQGPGVYVVNRDGTGLTKVVAGTAPFRPVWSPVAAPDGHSKILFEDSVGEWGDLFVVNPDGTGLVNLTGTTGASESHATWSRDASRVAAAVLDLDTRVERIVVYDLGLSDEELAIVSQTEVSVAGSPLEGGRFYHLDWARTSDRIALSAIRGDELSTPAEQWDLWVIDLADPGHPTNVTDTSGFRWERQPSWSSDDSRLAFWNHGRKVKSGIHTIAAGGGSATSLGAAGTAPAWRR